MPLETGSLPRGVIERQLEMKYFGGILAGQSRESIYQSTIHSDLGIRKSESLAISRTALEKANTQLAMRELSLSHPIQENYMTPTNIDEHTRYMFIVSVDIITPEGFLGDVHYVPVYSDEIMNKEDILKEAEAAGGMSESSVQEVIANDVELAYRQS